MKTIRGNTVCVLHMEKPKMQKIKIHKIASEQYPLGLTFYFVIFFVTFKYKTCGGGGQKMSSFNFVAS